MLSSCGGGSKSTGSGTQAAAGNAGSKTLGKDVCGQVGAINHEYNLSHGVWMRDPQGALHPVSLNYIESSTFSSHMTQLRTILDGNFPAGDRGAAFEDIVSENCPDWSIWTPTLENGVS